MTFGEVGINEEHFDVMAEKAVRIGGLANAYVALDKEDVRKIFEMCL